MTRFDAHHGELAVADDVAGLRCTMVNCYFIDHAHRRGGADDGWVLVDTGIPGSADKIRQFAEARYGADNPPEAILLTHCHFDHVGNLQELADLWNVPIYAHTYEMPYITGRARYAPPDPWVGGGVMPLTSHLYPRGPWNLGDHVRPLPRDHHVPGLPGWQWISTPGHSPGHVSFWRESDGTLIAGDAFVTTKQESALSVLTQSQHVEGPPAYFTHDWQSAKQSVRKLRDLKPSIAATGHGTPMWGRRLRDQLDELTDHFDDLALPKHGRYAKRPVQADETGPTYVPPPRIAPLVIAGASVLVAGLTVSAFSARKRRW
jgi:glyoxylase-like metal-dependent hydrolase (beta-lactamase superfamily II)